MTKNKIYFTTSLSSCFYKGNVALIKPAKAIKASKVSFSLVSFLSSDSLDLSPFHTPIPFSYITSKNKPIL